MTILRALNTPVFAAEGILHINLSDYILDVCGMIDRPKKFTLHELKAKFPHHTVNCRLTSVSGWSVRASWDGILWRDFSAAILPAERARYCLFASPAGYSTVVWLKDLEEGTAMLVWGVEGEPLEPEYGGPLRLLIPNLWGYKSCKWLSRIEWLEKYREGYWEVRGYSHRGLIEPGETFDVNSQKYRPIPGGEVTGF